MSEQSFLASLTVAAAVIEIGAKWTRIGFAGEPTCRHIIASTLLARDGRSSVRPPPLLVCRSRCCLRRFHCSTIDRILFSVRPGVVWRCLCSRRRTATRRRRRQANAHGARLGTVFATVSWRNSFQVCIFCRALLCVAVVCGLLTTNAQAAANQRRRAPDRVCRLALPVADRQASDCQHCFD